MGTTGYCYILLWIWLGATTQAAFRLPSTITPSKYILNLTPTLVSPFKYSGSVNITFQTSSAVAGDLNSISLHKDISVNVDNSSITIAPTIAISSTTYEDATQVYTIKLQTEMANVSTYTIQIPFSGTLRQDNLGLHVGSYTYNNITSYYLATNFYPIYARFAFPCFDEPKFKAVFEVTITKPSVNHIAVSNALIATPATAPSTTDVFAVTPMMSVHSLSIFVADNATLATDTTKTDYGTVLKYWKPTEMTPAFTDKNFNLFQTALEHNINITHPLGHLNIFILPDLKMEAFGGFGMIFLREDILMPYQKYMMKQAIESDLVILDQMIKQYVSHYVTPAWWSDVWLTEGVATYLKFVLLNYVTTGYITDQILSVNIREQALSMDMGNSEDNALVQSNITNTVQIQRAVSDDLKKTKAAAVLYMIDSSLTGAAFSTLVKKYLATKVPSTSTTTEFLRMITETNSEFTAMDSWFLSSGYPIVTVTRSGTNIILQQAPMYGTTTWNIPITYTYASQPESDWMATSSKQWLKTSTSSFVLNASTSHWMIFNIKSGGFYRLKYSPADLNLILNQLKSNSSRIDVINHAAIIDDIMALSTTGNLELETVLKFIKETSTHIRYAAWVPTIKALNFLKVSLYGQPSYNNFKTYVKALLQYPYDYVGYLVDLKESTTITMLRSLILPLACEFEVGDCVSGSNKVMDVVDAKMKSVIKGTDVYDDVDILICESFKRMNETTFQTHLAYYKSHHSRLPLQYLLASGFGCVTNEHNLKNLLSELNNGGIYDEDIETVFTKTYSIMDNVETVLNYIVDNAETLKQKHGTNLLLKLLTGIGSQLYSSKQLTKEMLNSIGGSSGLTALESSKDELIVSTVSSVKLDATARITWVSNNTEVLSKALNSVTSAAVTVANSAVLLFITLFIIGFNKPSTY